MSKIKLVLPVGNKTVLISNPFTKDFFTFKNLLLITNLISVTVFSLFIFVLPLLSKLFTGDSETITLKFLVVSVFTLLVLFLIRIVLTGSKSIIDPKGFLMVLVFNLVLTASSVMVATTRISNTFGGTGFRYLAGITLMSLIGVFYFTSLHTIASNSVRKLIDFFILGSGIFIVLQFLDGKLGQSQLVIASLPILVLAVFLSVYRLINQSKIDAAKLILFIIFLGLTLLIIPFNQSNYLTLFYFTLTFLISYLLVGLLYISRNKENFKNRLKGVLTSLKNEAKQRKIGLFTRRDREFVLALAVPVVLLLAAVFFYVNLNQKNVFEPVIQQYSIALQNLNGGAEFNSDNLRTILLGKGSDNYIPSSPLLVNVLIVQGVLGALIYIVLWIYFVNKAKGVFLYNLKDKGDFKLSGIFLMFLILMPLSLIFSYPNLVSIIAMWICFALIGNIKGDSAESDIFKTELLALKGSKERVIGLKILRLSTVILIIAAGTILVNFLLSVIK